MRWLKKIRVFVAVGFFLVITFILTNLGEKLIPTFFLNLLVALQVGPAVIKSLLSLSWFSVSLLIILLITLLFGRVYCSTLCPLGILQDVFIRLKRLNVKRNRFVYKKPLYTFHYFIFTLTVVLAVLGVPLFVILLEPFSGFSRIVANIINPILAVINNWVFNIFETFDLMFLYPIHIGYINVYIVVLVALFFILITFLALYRGRLYCNLLCPVGALLSLISRVSIFRISIDENNCIECGLCERVCKANCINSAAKEIDFSACIGCYNCIDLCPTNGVVLKRRRCIVKNLQNDVDRRRRQFLEESMKSFAGLILPIRSLSKKGGGEVSRRFPISPPGSGGIDRFSSICTACHLCVNSCPTQVLYPSFLDYGIGGILQPKMNYSISYCNYDCVRCGQVCPTGAILPLNPAEKKQVQIGRAVFIRENCIVVRMKTDCGACSEHCSTKAAHMVPYGNLYIPELNTDLCIGCGACEYACPAEPHKAMVVVSNVVHQKAKLPESNNIEPHSNELQDFPF